MTFTALNQLFVHPKTKNGIHRKYIAGPQQGQKPPQLGKEMDKVWVLLIRLWKRTLTLFNFLNALLEPDSTLSQKRSLHTPHMPHWACLDIQKICWEAEPVLWMNSVFDNNLQDHTEQAWPIESAPKWTCYWTVTDRKRERNQTLKSADHGLKHCTKRHRKKIHVPLSSNSWYFG